MTKKNKANLALSNMHICMPMIEEITIKGYNPIAILATKITGNTKIEVLVSTHPKMEGIDESVIDLIVKLGEGFKNGECELI